MITCSLLLSVNRRAGTFPAFPLISGLTLLTGGGRDLMPATQRGEVTVAVCQAPTTWSLKYCIAGNVGRNLNLADWWKIKFGGLHVLWCFTPSSSTKLPKVCLNSKQCSLLQRKGVAAICLHAGYTGKLVFSWDHACRYYHRHWLLSTS